MSVFQSPRRFTKRRRLVRVPMPSRDTRLIASTETKIERIATHSLLVVKNRVVAKLGHHTQKLSGDFRFAKRSATDDETMGEQALREFVEALNADVLDWDTDARKELRDLLQIVAEERASTSIDSLAAYLGDADMAAMVTQANDVSVAWAREHVGNLITNVSDTTRDAINEMTATAIESGWTNRELADELEDAWAFSPERALMIARTEPTFAETAGTLAGYRESGVVEGKGWSTEDPCDECQANEDDGIIALDEDFTSGDDGPPAHPFCKCSIYAAVYVGDEEGAMAE